MTYPNRRATISTSDATNVTHSRRILNGRLSLGDINDVEAFARKALHDVLRANGGRLTPELHEDALVALIELAWEQTQRYDPDKSNTLSAYLGRILRYRVNDWYRSTFAGRRQNRE